MALPAGVPGTRATLELMRQLVRRYKKNLSIRQLAFTIIDQVSGHKNFAGQAKAIHAFVQSNIQFVKDINRVETLATPTKTLEFRKGDCDDQAVLVASLLESIGHPTRFVAIKLKPFGPYVHVFTETLINGKWLAMETSEPWPAGMGPPKFAGRLVVDN